MFCLGKAVLRDDAVNLLNLVPPEGHLPESKLQAVEFLGVMASRNHDAPLNAKVVEAPVKTGGGNESDINNGNADLS